MLKSDFKVNAIRGIQAKKSYYSVMLKYKDLETLVPAIPENMTDEERNQRDLSQARVNKIEKYMLQNKNYIFNSLTVAVDGKIRFDTVDSDVEHFGLGIITIPKDAKVLINDGQHRRAGIIQALATDPELREETIIVEVHEDIGFENSKQWFVDINENAVKPNRSLSTLLDNRDKDSNIARIIMKNSDLFRGRTECVKSSISSSSANLVTLNQIKNITTKLTRDLAIDVDAKEELMLDFWNEMSKNVKDYKNILDNKEDVKTVRDIKLCGRSVFFNAVGEFGNNLFRSHMKDWKNKLKLLSKIDFHKDNEHWLGIAVNKNGTLDTTRNGILALASDIQSTLGIVQPPKKSEKQKVTKLDEFVQILKTAFMKDVKAELNVRRYRGKFEIVDSEKAHIRLSLKSLTGKAKPTSQDSSEMTNDEIQDKINELMDKAKVENEIAKKAEKEIKAKSSK